MSSFPTIPSQKAIGEWDMGTTEVTNPEEELTDVQLNALTWTATGLAVGVGGLVWALIRGSDGSKLAGGECWNPNGDPALSLVLATSWTPSTGYTLGTLVVSGGALFKCVGAGTSAGSGGPTGTGSSISDGSATWAYQSAGGWVVRLGVGSYQIKYAPAYPDETGTQVPLTLQVATAFPQTTLNLTANAAVTGTNTITVNVWAAGTPTDCNVLVCCR